MNMTELINAVQTSRATVYKRIKAAGIDLDAIRDEKGEILPEYVQQIADLFSDISARQDTNTETDTKPVKENAPDTRDIELAVLRERLAARDAEIQSLKDALAAARSDATAWAERFDREHAMLTAAPQQASIWQRMFGRKTQI